MQTILPPSGNTIKILGKPKLAEHGLRWMTYLLPSKASGSLHSSTRLLLCLTAPNIAKQGMRRVDNSMHRKSRRLLKNIVILSIANP